MADGQTAFQEVTIAAVRASAVVAAADAAAAVKMVNRRLRGRIQRFIRAKRRQPNILEEDWKPF